MDRGLSRRCSKVTLTFEEVLKVANDLMFAKKGRPLSEPEIVVMQGAWNDKDYEEIADNSRFTLNYLQRTVAPQLWEVLSEVIGNGSRVGKKRLRYFLEQVTRKYYFPSLSADTKPSSRSDTLLHVLGGQPPDTSRFYGRIPELGVLKELVVENRCVIIYGATGIGKSALAAKLIEEISVEPQSKFQCLIWKSVAYAPLLQDLVTELSKLTNPLEPEPELPEHPHTRISVLIKQLQSRRCLLVLDGAEALWQVNNSEQCAEYGLFFRRLVEEQHQSCLLLTSQASFDQLDRLAGSRRPIQCLKVKGLDSNGALQLLHASGLTDPEMCNELIQTYRGNPLDLEEAAKRINHFFAGSKEKFYEYKTTFISNPCQAKLNQYFGQARLLSELQRQIMIYLAEELSKNRNPVGFTKLLRDLSLCEGISVSASKLIEALEGLDKLSLVESDPLAKGVSYGLEPVVKKYILTDPRGLVRKSGVIAKSA